MKNKKFCKVLTVLLFNSLIVTCFGQSVSLRGSIIDEATEAPLSDVRIIINGEVVALTNPKGEFNVPLKDVKKSDRVRFWKTGWVFQTFQISSLENKNEMKIKLSSSRTKTIIMDPERETNEIFLDGIRITEEEWGDINPNEITGIAYKSADPNHDMKTTKIINIYLSTK